MSDRVTPDEALTARYGPFGGRYVPETVIAALDELTEAYLAHRDDVAFRAELEGLLARYVGRPTPLYRARGLEEAYGVERLYLKREDLCHTGAHKINNALGQVLLAHKMGKRRIIAETGAGQHGVATATAAALLGLECAVYMGRVDMARQRLNVIRMKMLGAEVVPVDSGIGTLKDALNEAIRDWVTNVRTTHYVIGTAAGPAPYPEIVAELQRVIGGRGARADAGGGGAPAGVGRRVRRRRLQRDRDLPRVPGRRRRGAPRGRGGRRGRRDGAPRGVAEPRRARRAARHLLVPAAERRGPGHRAALDLRGPRLPRRGPGAQLPARLGARAVRERHRRGGAARRSSSAAARRGSSRRWRAPTRWR